MYALSIFPTKSQSNIINGIKSDAITNSENKNYECCFGLKHNKDFNADRLYVLNFELGC